jgi:hypothetical protein
MRTCLAALFLLCASSAAPAQPMRGTILIFSHTTGYRHDSIPAGITAIEKIARRRGLTVVASEDPAIFSTKSLGRFRAIVLLSTTTDPKNPNSEWLIGDRRLALQQFVSRGGGVLAIHAAADSHYHWPWYAKLIGGRFASHPAGTPEGKVTIIDPSHSANRDLPRSTRRADEWYYFDDFDATSKLLMTLDPGSIGERDVNPNPLVWTRETEGGPLFYTAMGHTKESYSEPFFLRHLTNGLDWILARTSKQSLHSSDQLRADTVAHAAGR